MRLFDYDGIATRVDAARPATLDWLEEFHSPWFTAGEAGDAPRIEVRFDAEEVRALVAGATPTGDTVDCFTMDQARAPWSLLRGREGVELAREPDLRVVLRKRPGGLVLVAETERPQGRLVLLRALREFAGARATARGDLPLHGAAVAVAGRVTLFVGGKRSGKSTLLLHALRDPEARFVANDRVYLRHGTARGMPTVVSLREGSLGRAPGLRDELASGAWHHASTVAEARANRAEGRRAPGVDLRWPPGLSAAQLCALLGTTAVAAGPVERLVFPRIGDADRFTLTELDAAEAARRLLDDGLLAGGRIARWIVDVAPPPRAALEDAVHRLAASVPCFACALGPGAYEPPSVWEALRSGPR